MDDGRYRHNNKGFNENFTFPQSIHRGRTTIIRAPMQACENYPLSSLPLLVMSVQEEIQSSKDCVDTARGWMLEQLKDSLK